ncbi:MFS transporter [Actinomadura parmotrematis]|uniref:MFS transporter n=1 Tax=Actinomadura parmotrematis TaxID=2864039 RepID=A0ABS7FNC2_9ACTN|nr:MFS transporter [Actinomadura parmotrematis]MBW8481894.1 MFS transporter [Actinomadura parmotrematis]
MRRERIAWAGLAAMTVSFGLNFSMGVFFAPTASDYGVSPTALALTAALGTLLTGLAQPFIGGLLDRVGARAVLAGGLVLVSGSYLTLAVVQQTWQFVTAYMLLGGLGFAASSSLTVTTLIGRAHGDRAGPALARAALGINLGQLLGPWAATSLFEPVGVRAAYALLGSVGIAVTAVLWLVLPANRFTVRGGVRRGEPLTGRGRVLASFGLHAATLYVVVLMLPEHAVETGWPIEGAGRLVAVAAAAAAATSAAVVRLLRHHRPETLLRALYAVRAVALVLAVAVPGETVLIVVAVLFGAASFPVIPLTMAIVSRGLDPARMGRSLAPAWVIHQLSAAAGLGVATAVHAATGGYRGYFALALGLTVAAALLLTPARAPEPAARRA